MMRRPGIAMLSFALLGFIAAQASAADQVLVSRKGNCRMTVPAGWRVGAVLKSTAASPDKTVSALISTSADDTDLAFAKNVMESSYPPTQVFEDTARRLFYQYDSGGGKRGYYVGVPSGHGSVCGAQIVFSKGKEATARQIAASVGPAH